MYCSRKSNQRLEQEAHKTALLSEYKVAFINKGDSFYQVTTSESGWTDIQHRGGLQSTLHSLAR